MLMSSRFSIQAVTKTASETQRQLSSMPLRIADSCPGRRFKRMAITRASRSKSRNASGDFKINRTGK